MKKSMSKKEREDFENVIRNWISRCDEYRIALRDLISFWDRVGQLGWTAKDMERIRQIRELAE